ncbi:SMI1-KNR4 cell-wall [Anaerosporobacter mobilis DSM 15930]|uniref:SMI1-KNR4 cell-wall n=1 Tax=Anaerosporobacter mobilis DSM 15930 TaxID=1120996 RepID=A0A1M7NGC9_9FIRM|nr:SMI1/KNR4 family protein [Anaerosporobacter mobilis]SHN02796.1 SMI1-KNR4 cell-wall [Anaerosporobacter mobilis DSM 15930]
MNKEIMKLTQTMKYNSFSSEETIKSVELEIDMIFPTQYREFMLETNGAEGNIGQNSYLAIWSIEEIVSLNIDGKVEEFTPELVQFASDGGGMAYAFDKRDKEISIVAIPDDSIHIEDAEFLGKTFQEFLQYLYDTE